MGERLEGLEARLKHGICMVKLENIAAARKSFRSLRGTPLEPYALGEEAMLEPRWNRTRWARKPCWNSAREAAEWRRRSRC